MANYAQINPGRYHLGYRFPTPILVDELNMQSENDHRIELKFKHSIIVNRTVYVGNVQVFSRKNGTIKVETDSMYKSIVNEFDVFADYNKIEASVNDGENITALAEFANKVLQYKQNTLYIINVSGQIEVLESTNSHKGVNGPSSVCKTDYGIAWANKHGCYLYDGRSILNLIEKDGMKRISDSSWTSFLGTNPMVGYFPNKRQIIIVDAIDDTKVGSCFIYDLVTKSWIKSKDGKFEDAIKSNFINDYNGDLVYATSATPKKWTNTSVSGSISFISKDIDFGQPSVRKKIYRVRISYKGQAAALSVKYSVNGDTDTLYLFEGTSNGSPTGSSDASPLEDKSSSDDLTKWNHAELKPSNSSESNNVYSFQLHISGTATANIEFNDITIVYRSKNIK